MSDATSGYLNQTTLTETERMLQKLKDRAVYWRNEAVRVRSSNPTRGETAGLRYDAMAYELEWAVRQMEALSNAASPDPDDIDNRCHKCGLPFADRHKCEERDCLLSPDPVREAEQAVIEAAMNTWSHGTDAAWERLNATRRALAKLQGKG